MIASSHHEASLTAGCQMDTKSKLKFMLRLPPDVKCWLEREANKNASSKASEIVRAIREKMDRHRVFTSEAQDAS